MGGGGGEEQERGVALVQQGIAELLEEPVAYAEELAEARAWLAARGLSEAR